MPGMRVLFAPLLAAWTFLALFAVEQTADYFYLAHNPEVFFTISGLRLTLFIAIVVAGSVAAGRLLKRFWASAAAECAGISAAFLTLYVACDPRVCFSTGVDGLEWLRMGFFLTSVAVAGAALGVTGGKLGLPKPALVLVGFFGFVAVTFLPVSYTFAGTLVLWWLHPWALLAILALAGYSVGASVAAGVSRKVGAAVPVASIAVLLLLSAGFASAYLSTLMTDALLMLLVTACSSGLGAFYSTRGRSGAAGMSSASRTYLLGLVLVLLILLFTVPDAVTGVVPQSSSQDAPFVMGVPVYAGAYMDAPPGHALGAGVTVDLSATNSSVIQEDNFLSAGLGIHAAGCCVDGIDYSYRADVYLFHTGSELLVATGWEVCDNNAACGGHSWKLLLFEAEHPIPNPSLYQNVTLHVMWEGGALVWSYSMGGGPFSDFARFTAPSVENRDFNTGALSNAGALAGGGLNLQESGVYFFQFGIMSRYPIGPGGWRVGLECPSIFVLGWTCVDHARTLSGSQSFWKVIWRWGEDYPGVSVGAYGNRTVEFAYSRESVQDFQSLW